VFVLVGGLFSAISVIDTLAFTFGVYFLTDSAQLRMWSARILDQEGISGHCCVLVGADLRVSKDKPRCTVRAIQRPGFVPYAVIPFLGGPLFHLLVCNGRCLCLLLGFFQKIHSTAHWRIGCLHKSCCAFVRCRSQT